jgi:hypothetical protein
VAFCRGTKFGVAPIYFAPGRAALMTGKPDPHAIKQVLRQLAKACEAGELDAGGCMTKTEEEGGCLTK